MTSVEREGSVLPLDNKELQVSILRLHEQILRPQLRHNPAAFGRFAFVDIEKIVSDPTYAGRIDILDMMASGPWRLLKNFRRTKYWRKKLSQYPTSLHAFLQLVRYYRLFHSMKRDGIKASTDDITSVPWLFAAKELYRRLDGHHRASVARYLGKREILALIITPSDVLRLPDLPVEWRNFVGLLHDPPEGAIRHFKMPADEGAFMARERT